MLFLSSLPGCSVMTYLHVELPQFLLLAWFLHAPVGDSFANGAIHSTMWIHWVELTWSSPRAPRICWKSNEIMYCRSYTSCGFNDRNATLQVDFFTHQLWSTTLELEFFNVLCFVLPNKIRIQFRFQSQCCIYLIRKILLTRFSS